MSTVVLLHLRTHPARFLAPLVSLAALWFTLASSSSWAGDRLLAASAAEFGVTLVAPVALLAGALAARRVSLADADVLLNPTQRLRRLRIMVVSLCGAVWFVAGLLGIWGAVAIVSRRVNPLGTPYLLPLAVAVACVVAASVIGCVLGARSRGPWPPVVGVLLAYVALAGWAYLPWEPAQVLIPRSWHVFDTLPRPGLPFGVVQLAWVAVVTAATVFGATTTPRRRAAAAAATVLWGACAVVAAGWWPALVAREGSVPMVCRQVPKAPQMLCLWADHEYHRAALETEVRLGSRLGGGLDGLAWLVTEGDYDTDGAVPQQVVQAQRANTAGALVVETGVDVDPRRLAASMVRAGLVRSQRCPDPTFRSYPFVPAPDVVASVVEKGSAPWQGAAARRLSPEALTLWISSVQEAMSACRPLPEGFGAVGE